jgi:hypothetical protein
MHLLSLLPKTPVVPDLTHCNGIEEAKEEDSVLTESVRKG